MYPCTKFQLNWRTSHFGTKFAQKNDKNFEKINIKIITSIKQCNSLRDFSQFEELQSFRPNFPAKKI